MTSRRQKAKIAKNFNKRKNPDLSDSASNSDHDVSQNGPIATIEDDNPRSSKKSNNSHNVNGNNEVNGRLDIRNDDSNGVGDLDVLPFVFDDKNDISICRGNFHELEKQYRNNRILLHEANKTIDAIKYFYEKEQSTIRQFLDDQQLISKEKDKIIADLRNAQHSSAPQGQEQKILTQGKTSDNSDEVEKDLDRNARLIEVLDQLDQKDKDLQKMAEELRHKDQKYKELETNYRNLLAGVSLLPQKKE
jgi:hypothetical protein